MKEQQPILLSPAYKDYLWGGTKLKIEWGKETDLEILAESWELSAHKDGQSMVKTGAFAGCTLSDYIEKNGKESLGTKAEGMD